MVLVKWAWLTYCWSCGRGSDAVGVAHPCWHSGRGSDAVGVVHPLLALWAWFWHSGRGSPIAEAVGVVMT